MGTGGGGNLRCRKPHCVAVPGAQVQTQTQALAQTQVQGQTQAFSPISLEKLIKFPP